MITYDTQQSRRLKNSDIFVKNYLKASASLPHLSPENTYKLKLPPAAYEINKRSSSRLEEFETLFSKGYISITSKNPEKEISKSKPQVKVFKPNITNTEKANAIFEICIGKGRLRKTISIGCLVTQSIALTTNLSVSSQLDAERYQLVFFDPLQSESCFNPSEFFYTDPILNFTLVAVDKTPITMNKKCYFPIIRNFNLSEGSKVVTYFQGFEYADIDMIEDDYFYFNLFSKNPNGAPLFTEKLDFQGIQVVATPNYTTKQALRTDAIFKSLWDIRYKLKNQELIDMLEESELEEKPNNQHGHDFFWFEWLTTNIYYFNFTKQTWKKIKPENSREINNWENWHFNWNNRLGIDPKGNWIIAGGIENSNGNPSNEIFLYKSESNILQRLPNMLEPREECSVVCISHFIYILGGKNSNASCERYNRNLEEWELISPMIYERYGHAAHAMNAEQEIFVFGGNPYEIATTIEKYNIGDEKWEEIELRLSEPFIQGGLYKVNENKLILFGGAYSNQVNVFQINEESSKNTQEDSYKYSINKIKKLAENIQTFFPTFLDWSQNSIIIMNGTENFNNFRVSKYSFDNYTAFERKISKAKKGPQSYRRFPELTILHSARFLPPLSNKYASVPISWSPKFSYKGFY
ncbi:unnamed protein product [Blepharisma stoltei]|uniref:Uncharacterized protein n=1 Tax=Blepharisma stoltei TaxID=1481888 RepID=A0AAU9IQE4_9CILI|nr:unnamed protein product [Blepharisma stoltei]